MRTFRLLIAYDGTQFHGWQRQPGKRTVQGVLEDALRAQVRDDSVSLAGAGRTDAGVHARGQVASFESGTRLPARAIAPRLKVTLPADVRVCASHEAAAGFHARHAARARRYSYLLLRREDLLLERYAWNPRRAIDLDRLARATRVLERTDDFSAFRSMGSSPGDAVCHVFRTGWSAEGAVARLEIVADHFLYHMVRSIVGTALQVSAAPDPAAEMTAILVSRDRRRAGQTAPARGLCLEQVYYDGEESG